MVAAGHDAAVHVPDGAGAPGVFVGEQKIGDGGNVLGAADTADGMEAVESGDGLLDLRRLDERAIDRGGDDGGRDGVHADFVFRQFDGEVLGDGVNRPGAMERAVEGLSAKVLNACVRRNLELGILEKLNFPEIPPRVEYRFTPLGRRFRNVLAAGEKFQAELEQSVAVGERQ